MASATNNIVVVGSCMIDFVSYAPRLPKEGETIHGTKFATNFGGKGANQCVAAANLGGSTTLIARVGDDIWGDRYISNLQQLNIRTDFVRKTPNLSTGIAQITVSEKGQNQIVIVAGANNKLSVTDLLDDQTRTVIENAAVLVLQLETSAEVALKAAELCENLVILNGAPALSGDEFDPELLKVATIFCVNETEAAVFSGLSVTNKSDAILAAKKLLSMGCNSVLITLGAQGAIYLENKKSPSDNNGADRVIEVRCPDVQCVDSTGAGDAFIGALSYLLANHKNSLSMRRIIEVACFVASDSVTRPGTQISFPKREIFDECKLE